MNMPNVTKPEVQFLIAGGVVGGLFLGYQAATHMFVEGLTPGERKNMLLFAGASLGVWAVSEMFDLEEVWKKIEQEASDAAR